MIIDENRVLDVNEKRRVLERAGELGFTCGGCGSGDFEVGEALYLGFLFLSEDHDAYMVALACENPGCESPRTGIRLRAAEFLKGPARDDH